MEVRSTPVTFVNRAHQRLFGILSEPASVQADAAVVLLNPGTKMRVGPNRLYLRMAERFVAQGYAVLRFDFAGLGDSEGDVPESQTADLFGAIQTGRYVDDVSASIDWLVAEKGIRRVVAGGLCGGAITALLAAERDPRIVSVLGLGMPVILDGAHIDFSKYMTPAELAGQRRDYLWKLRLWEPRVWLSWWRLVTGRSHYSHIVRTLLQPVKARLKRKAAAHEVTDAPITDNTNPRFAPAMRHVFAKRRPILLVFGEEDRLLMEYTAKYVGRHQSDLDRAASLYELHVIKQANHIFSLDEWRDDLLDRCDRWLQEHGRGARGIAPAVAPDAVAATRHAPAAAPAGGPVRVLYCESNADGTIGGSYFSLLYLIQGLDKSRYRPTVVFQRDHVLMDEFRATGAEILIWPLSPPSTLGREPGLLRPLRLVAQKGTNLLRGFFWQAVQRARFLRREGFALVHLNNSLLRNEQWMLAARLAGVPCLTHERGINDFYPESAKKLGRRLGAIICISDAVRQTLVRAGADFGNLVTIHNALDPAALQVARPAAELRASVGIPSGAVVIGMVGNIRAWKGQDTLLRALERVRRVVPDAYVVFIGDTAAADRGFREQLDALIAELGLEGRVVFSGYQRCVADWIGASDVIVHASVQPEPFGRVILEAMALRKPVIGAAAGAIPEIIEEGRTGWTFPPGDDQKLAEALISVVGDFGRAREIGERGYARLVSSFDIRRNVDQTQAVYERLLRAAG